jgi:hypothetical protein
MSVRDVATLPCERIVENGPSILIGEHDGRFGTMIQDELAKYLRRKGCVISPFALELCGTQGFVSPPLRSCSRHNATGSVKPPGNWGFFIEARWGIRAGHPVRKRHIPSRSVPSGGQMVGKRLPMGHHIHAWEGRPVRSDPSVRRSRSRPGTRALGPWRAGGAGIRPRRAGRERPRMRSRPWPWCRPSSGGNRSDRSAIEIQGRGLRRWGRGPAGHPDDWE